MSEKGLKINLNIEVRNLTVNCELFDLFQYCSGTYAIYPDPSGPRPAAPRRYTRQMLP